MKGQQESLTTVVIKQAGHPAPENNSTDGSRLGWWQTATVLTGAHKQKDGSMTDKLDQQVKTWATPQSRDAKGAEGRMIREGHCSDLPSQTEVAPTGQWNRSNGKLNPRWVCTLMNLPVFWVKP